MNHLIPNLIFLYHVIVASEKLLKEAIAKGDDSRLRNYFEHHLEEEKDHAKWLAEDLQCVGIDVTRTDAPLVAIQMVGSIYYLIFHSHSAALLGYMLVLESWPMNREKFSEMGRPYPNQLLRTLNYHMDHDPAHLRDLVDVISSVPEHRKLISDVAAMTRACLMQAAIQIQSPPVRLAG